MEAFLIETNYGLGNFHTADPTSVSATETGQMFVCDWAVLSGALG